MKPIIDVLNNKKETYENTALAAKVKATCIKYAEGAYEIDKSKTLTEWYQFFLAAMRDKYRKAKLSKALSTENVDNRETLT